MRKLKSFGTYFFLTIVSLISVFPLYWMIAAATNNSTDVLAGKLTIGMNLIQNLSSLLERQNVGRAFGNSLLFSGILSILSLLVCSVAGYGIEIYHDKAKDTLMSVLLLAMMVPFAATLIPLFKLFTGMHLQSTWIAYILPTISTPFLIMLFRQSARSFPVEIIEAARIDDNFLVPKVIMMSETSQTMPMLVANLASGYSIDYGVLMLGVLICSLPTGILFLVLQKSFANGIVGAVKG